ncbi:prokineticin domain-containing protein [Trichonephila inaurata madagascariensis]|uniref:Prokineticin domain-containing protein n=1 Tax=Trichonephila inaurata madagascariensis TaxID=2747483 RepID=A0A8X7CKK8_9ARAC|nr:prokineticin domain-containing protein [Trichonephila inaurata madagascariensis]
MKSLCVLALVFCCVYVAVAEVNNKCESNADCDEDECCVSFLQSLKHAKCKKLRGKGDWCVPNVNLHEQEKYHYMCPCVEGLNCIPEEVEERDDGIIIYRNSKCLELGENSTVY